MKHLKYILFLVLLLLPLKIKAYVDYDITNYYIDATIAENGDLKIEELIILDGSFHGYVRDITYKNSNLTSNSDSYANNDIYNAKGITDVKIAAMKVESEPSFQMLSEVFLPLERVYFEEDAQNGNYVETSIQDGKSYKMYYEGNDEKVAYRLSYTIKSAVVMHQDIAELYWNFIGDGYDDPIHNLEIKIHLPEYDNTDNLRFWGHGDITGDINKEDNKTILAKIKSLKKNSPVDVRVTFSPSLITDATNLNKSSDIALPNILEVETKRALAAEQQKKLAHIIYLIVVFVTVILLTGYIIWWIVVYFLFDREYTSTFVSKYNREFIDEYNVEVVDYLMNHTVTSNAMTASILNLIYKKNISVKEISKEEKKKVYEFTLENRNNTTDTEDVLLDFLFEVVGKENKFTSLQLDRYAKGNNTYMTFQSKYNNWLSCVKKDGERCAFFETNGIPIVSAIFILLISLFVTFFVYYYNVDFIPSYFLGPVAVAFMIYSLLLKKRTKKGNEHYVRWLAFKRFLQDFGTFETKQLPEIALWERYLVYAAVFGLTDEVEKAMNTKIKEYAVLYPEYSFTDLYFNYHLANFIHHSVTNSIEGMNVAATRHASSSNTSGFGGGFSGGGGFGGGGGGGHGF